MTVVEFNHYSVMLHETIEQLNINPDGIYVLSLIHISEPTRPY